jgi:Tfp pilus assembly protein PilF
MLATALEQTGDYRSARIQVDRVLAIDPHNSDAIALRNALNKPAAQKAANQQAG